MLVYIKGLDIDLFLVIGHPHRQYIDGHSYFDGFVNLLRILHVVIYFLFDLEHLADLDTGLVDRIPVLHHLVPTVIIGIVEVTLAGVVLEGEEPTDDFNADITDGETDLHGQHIPPELAVLDRQEPTYSLTKSY